MIRFVIFSARRAWQGFWRNALMSLAATATMVLMLLLLSGFWIAQTGLLAGLDFVEQKVEVVADLRDGTTATEAARIRARLLARPEVADAVYVSPEDALARFRERLAEQGEEDLTQYLDDNPLRASLEVKLVDAREFGDVIDLLVAEPAVESVKDIAGLVDRVLAVTDTMRTVGLVVLVAISIIVLFIIVNTIRLAVLARAEEIEIMRLVGASDAFIRWPFVVEGAMVGMLGAGITLALLAVAADPISGFMFEFFRVLPLQLGSLARDLSLLILGAGVGLGILGSWISVRTYLIR
ncbi:MAG TPA: permease-like cell division protein FtsX [Candidatus Limnocylindrales bacterium]|nr:permease-like cell division protein FtsX [Candidatus Limnocylindrales bacterium]